MKSKLLEMFPYGMAYGFNGARPVMLFRDESNRHVLPVWVSALDAAVISNMRSPTDVTQSPHMPSVDLVLRMGYKLTACVFHEMKGPSLYCRLQYQRDGLPAFESEVRAELSMSYCMAHETRFFTDPLVIQACRQVQADAHEGPIGPVSGIGRKESIKQKYMN